MCAKTNQINKCYSIYRMLTYISSGMFPLLLIDQHKPERLKREKMMNETRLASEFGDVVFEDVLFDDNTVYL